MRAASSGIGGAYHLERSPFLLSVPERRWFRPRLLSLLHVRASGDSTNDDTQAGACKDAFGGPSAAVFSVVLVIRFMIGQAVPLRTFPSIPRATPLCLRVFPLPSIE